MKPAKILLLAVLGSAAASLAACNKPADKSADAAASSADAAAASADAAMSAGGAAPAGAPGAPTSTPAQARVVNEPADLPASPPAAGGESGSSTPSKP